MISIVTTLIELAGLAAVAYGVWLIFPPAGFIVIGIELLVLAWRLA